MYKRQEQIPEKEARLEKLKATSANVNTFVEKAKQYTAIDELTPEPVSYTHLRDRNCSGGGREIMMKQSRKYAPDS